MWIQLQQVLRRPRKFPSAASFHPIRSFSTSPSSLTCQNVRRRTCAIRTIELELERAVTSELGSSMNDDNDDADNDHRVLLQKDGLPKIKIERIANAEYAETYDFQSSFALSMAKRVGRTPHDLAQAVLRRLEEEENPEPSPGASEIKHPMLEKMAISGPGFFIFKLNATWMAEMARDVVRDLVLDSHEFSSTERVLVDFASPNMGKELHVGHLRSSVLGDTLSRMYEYQGQQVSRVSHVGDFGSALATLLAQVLYRAKKEEEDDLHHSDVQDQLPSLEDWSPAQLTKSYEAGKRRAKTDLAFVEKVNDIVVQMQHLDLATSSSDMLSPSDSNNLHLLWTQVCAVSRSGFERLFAKLNVRVQERGESCYQPHLASLVIELEAKGLVVDLDGAKGIFAFGPEQPPCLIQKRDGGYLYATTDLVALKQRCLGLDDGQVSSFHNNLDELGYDRLVYVTDASQQLHFQQLFKIAVLAGWTTDTHLEHLSFGLVQGTDGRKLSSRKGEPISLETLLDEAVLRASESSKSKKPQRDSGVQPKAPVVNKEAPHQDLRTNEIIGYNAVRYFELAHQRHRNYQFTFDKALNPKGNTSIYLMYAYARIQSVLNSSPEPEAEISMQDWTHLAQSSASWASAERKLVLQLLSFQRALDEATRMGCPHTFCDYLYQLAAAYHGFYNTCSILNGVSSKERRRRLTLCRATALVLGQGMDLLGLQSLAMNQRM